MVNPSHQDRQSSRQAVVRPLIIDIVVSVDELEEPGPTVQGQKWKAVGLVPTVMKQVCIAYGLVDLEEELEQASYLLEVV